MFSDKKNKHHNSIWRKSKNPRLIFRSLRYRNFRLFFSGQLISLIGTWMQTIAMSWLVYRLTNSAFILGLVGFFSQIPAFLLTPFAGVLIDRWNRHRILVITQTLSMLQAFVIAFLVIKGVVAVWHIIFLSLLLGLINAFDIPTRQSFIIDMVEKKEDLANAIALNSSMFNLARLIGPSIAGILIAVVGEGMCFLFNGISFLAVIIALLAMKNIPKGLKSKRSNILEELKEGVKYVFGFIPIRFILLLLSLISLVGMSYAVLMPVFARNILGGGPHTLGFLMGSIGLGALFATIYLASRTTVLGLVKIIAIATSIFGMGLVFFSFSSTLWLSLIILFITGFAMMVQMASSNTILQTIAEDDKRGRVMSFYTMSFMGVAPFGSLIAGILASKIGAAYTVTIGGFACLLGAVVFASKINLFREKIHPIYVKLGFFPQVTPSIKPPD
ncbi:MAG: MFS transporter [Candidatus Omnitrophota bacterium]|nr:MFS transporter [Candidatus Omnitrophota bacterium]